MAREGIAALLCATVLVTPLIPPLAAVHVLEQQLAKINGNREYLACLRDAYRGHIKELRQAGRGDEAQTYLRRLEILDPGARLDFPDARRAEPVAVKPPVPVPVPVPGKESGTGTGTGGATPPDGGPKPGLTVRGTRPDDAPPGDPFH